MKKELLRMLCSVWFVLGICFTLALCFFSEIIISPKYTILQVLNNMSRTEMAQEPQLITAAVLKNAFGGYVALFVPVVAALPMLELLHTETQSGYKRFYMGRRAHWEYYWNKWIAGMISGALMLLTVAVLFHVFKVLAIPEADTRTADMQATGWDTKNMFLEVVKSYTGIAVYGAFSVIPAIIISSFTNNIYFMVCLPFMLGYFWDAAISSALTFMRSHQTNAVFSGIVENLFSRSYLYLADSVQDLLVQGVRITVSLTVLLLVYGCFLRRKRDCGE